MNTEIDLGKAILFVHAHPDDESASTGGAIARYVREGRHVTVVTCTRGEQGKIGLPELRHLAADQDDTLGLWRAAELACALRELGVTDHRYLLGRGAFRDSGRRGAPSNDRPDAFWQADLDRAAIWLANVIREIKPAVVVTYDPYGGYGHPDHIQAHRVTMRGIEFAASPALPGIRHVVPRVLWCAVPAETIGLELAELKLHQADHPEFWVETDLAEYPDGVHPAAHITCELDISADYDAKCRALACHRTQLSVQGCYWRLASGRGMRIQDREWFIEVPGPGRIESVARHDLFEGLD